MKLRVLMFAAAKDAVGGSEVTLELPQDATVQELRSLLISQYPRLKVMASTLLFAVNNRGVAYDFVLSHRDEIACFPPVSGG